MASEPDIDRDDRLARLGRDWFAEVRARHRSDEEAESKRRGSRRDDSGSTSDDGDGGWFDRLFGDCDADDAACDASGD